MPGLEVQLDKLITEIANRLTGRKWRMVTTESCAGVKAVQITRFQVQWVKLPGFHYMQV